jgi:3-(3-hydroxy-phenyl)propionate hydroxylase
VLLNLGVPGGFDITPWAGWVKLIDASHEAELPALGEVTAPAAVLIGQTGMSHGWATTLTRRSPAR